MKTVRIICLVLVLALSVTLLSACSLLGNVPVESGVGEDGRFIYSVVRGDGSSAIVETSAKNIRNAIKDNFECKVNMVKDSVVEYTKNSCEILIGDTNRPESAKAKEILIANRENNVYDFIVTVIDNKVCIQAATENMLSVACEWFVETFCKDLESWKLLKRNYRFIYEPETANVTNTVSGVNIGKFTVVKPLRMSYLIGIEVENFIEYYKENGMTMDYIDDIDPEVEYEILIGDTSREESQSVKVEGDNYIIKVVGTKLVIKGGNDLASWRGVKHFYDLLIEAGTDNPFAWSDGYVINGKYDATEENAYTLNFADEFEGSSVDLSVWGDYNYQASRSLKSCLGGTLWYSGPMNESTGYGKPLPYKNVYQSDGTLKLSTYKLNDTDFVGTYASTYYSMLFKYGVWEIRGKQGVRPGCMSYWLNGTGEQNLTSRYGNIRRSCFTEIDLIENYGNESRFGSCVHRWWTDYASDGITSMSGHTTIGGNARYYSDDNNANYDVNAERWGGNTAETFNIYTLYWTDECYKFAFNGKVYLTYNYGDESSVSIHCLLNYINLHFRMGDASYGATWKKDESPEYSEAEIDWLRVYQTGAINSQMVKSGSEYVDSIPTTIVYPDNDIIASY